MTMSNYSKSDELKRQLKEWIKLARVDRDVRGLFQELIEIAEKDNQKDKGKQKKSKKVADPEINPFQIIRESGKEGLERTLENLEANALIEIIRHYGLDPSRKSHKWRNDKRLRELIVDRVHGKSVQGNVFS